MERLRIIASPDAGARAQGVLAKQIDLALQLGPSESDALDAGGAKGLPYTIAEVWAYQFHQVTGGHPALRDKRVREALNIAVDREAIVKELFHGRAVPAREPGPAVAFGYDPNIPPIPHDPARAKKLLADAGYPNGFRFVMQAVIGSGPADGDVYQKVAQDLAKIGVTMEIRQFPVQQLFRGVIEGVWDGDAFGLTYATPPTVDVLRGITNHSCLGAHPWYCDQAIMPTIRAAFTEADPAKALALRQEIMRSYRDNYAALYLYELTRFAGAVAGLRGFAEVHGFISYDQIEIK
jgi:ABC-type transport system substrate-binding protein